MVPNITSELVLQLKNLKPGNCIAFGSAFKVPVSMYIDLPNPRPLSNNVNLEEVWYQNNNMQSNVDIKYIQPIKIEQTSQSGSINQENTIPSPNRFINVQPEVNLSEEQ